MKLTTQFQNDVKTGRQSGKNAARSMLATISHEAACAFWRENKCSATAHAYGYWDGFLTALATAKDKAS